MFFASMLGTLLVSHVQRAWLGRKNRLNGAFFLTAVSLLILSGYALYHLGSESLRNADGKFHLWLGVAATPLLCWHIWSGRNAANRVSTLVGAQRSDAARDREIREEFKVNGDADEQSIQELLRKSPV